MNLSLSAGGTPDQVRSTLEHQLHGQLGPEPSQEKQAIADAVMRHVAQELADRTDTVSVSVSASIYVTPAPVPAEPEPAAAPAD